MAKRIIEENVVLTKFELDGESVRATTQAHTTFAKKTKETYKDLNAQLAQISRAVEISSNKMALSLQKLQYLTEAISKGIANSVQKAGNQQVIVQKRVQAEAQKTRSAFGSLLRTLGSIEQTMYRLSAGLFVLGYSVSKLVTNQKDLYFLSQRIGMPVEDISRYAYVVSRVGGNADKARQSLINFTQTLQDMARGQNTQALEIFGRLGISTFNRDGSIKSTQQALDELRAKLINLHDKKTAVNYLTKLGFEQSELNYFLQDISFIESEYERLYKTITGMSSEDFLRSNTLQVTAFYNELQKLSKTINILMEQVFRNVLPALDKLTALIQDKLLINSKNINKTLTFTFSALLEGVRILMSFVDMLFEFTGALVDMWNNLDESEKRIAKLGVAFFGFLKLFSSNMLRTPFGRMLVMISMLLLAIQDYVYWKKQMAGENFASEYDWSWLDDIINKFDGSENKYDGFFSGIADWLDVITEKLDIATVAVIAFVYSLMGKSLPKTLGTIVMRHPVLAGIGAAVGAGTYLYKDLKDAEENNELGTVEKGLYWITNKIDRAFSWASGNKRNELSEEGDNVRDEIAKKDPAEFFQLLLRNKDVRQRYPQIEEGQLKFYSQEANKERSKEGPKYLNSNSYSEREKYFYEVNNINPATRRDLSNRETLEGAIAYVMRNKKDEGKKQDIQVPDIPLMENIQNISNNSEQYNMSNINEKRLGAETTVINNNKTVHITKGNTTVTIQGNADTNTVNQLENTLKQVDNAFFSKNIWDDLQLEQQGTR